MPLNIHENHLNTTHFEFGSNELKVKDTILSHRANIDFETSSPHTIGQIPLGGIVTKVILKVLTAFNGSTPTLNVGVSGNDTKYADYTALPIETQGTHIKHLYEREIANVDAIATITLNGATQGTAEILLEYSTN